MTTHEEKLKTELSVIRKASRLLDAVEDAEVRTRVAQYLAEKYAHVKAKAP
jgi:hypothetical protein